MTNHTDQLLTTTEVCALYHKITGRTMKPNTWYAYEQRGQGVTRHPTSKPYKPVWSRNEVTAWILARPRAMDR